ncbi:DUF3024 domain-containing protein [candidate division WOR-3 bacterium]|nr:DUF3024 domain-containing protein [candidate division WOR-3 bacterium]
MKMSFSEKYLWAKKAAMLNIDTDKGYEEFHKMAKESGLGTRWLTYYANAYEAAGESGLKALTYRKKMPVQIQAQALEKINEYLSNRVPVHLRSEIGFLVKTQNNRITVFEKRPLFSDTSKEVCIEAVQIRYTDFDKRWHLYWMRKFHIWWPYIPEQPVYTIDDCIREVKGDIWGCFWG